MPPKSSRQRTFTFLALISAMGAWALGPLAYTQPEAAAEEREAPAAVFEDDPAARGDTPSARQGYDIAKRSDRTDYGFGDSIVKAEMVLRNAAGQETRRTFTFYTLEKENEQVGDKSMVVFQSPPDVESTSLLSHANILEPDDQWLFLPALNRVKRISSANKSGPFVGSEFAFEDFTITELNKFTYEYVGEDTYDGLAVDVVDRFPRYEKSGYSRQRVLVDQDIFQPRRLEFFDRRGDLLKTLTLEDYRNYDGVWRPHAMRMVNHQSGKSTDLVYEEFKFRSGLTDRDFSRGVLGRIQ